MFILFLHREMDFIVAQVVDFDRKLDRQISDLDDIRIIMETQKKIRDQEIDMDMKIDLVNDLIRMINDLNGHFLRWKRRFPCWPSTKSN